MYVSVPISHFNLCFWPPVQYSSVAQLCLTLCNPMDCSTPGFPVYHQLPELTQTHIHWVGDAIQPSHPLLSPSLPAFNLSQHQGLFQWISSSHQVANVLELQSQHQSFQWIFRTDFLSDGLVGFPCRTRDSQESDLQFCYNILPRLWVQLQFTFFSKSCWYLIFFPSSLLANHWWLSPVAWIVLCGGYLCTYFWLFWGWEPLVHFFIFPELCNNSVSWGCLSINLKSPLAHRFLLELCELPMEL